MNPKMQVLIQQGYFDLAVPYRTVEYVVDHLDVAPELISNVRIEYYDAGHMMYVHPASMAKFKKTLADFVTANAQQRPDEAPDRPWSIRAHQQAAVRIALGAQKPRRGDLAANRSRATDANSSGSRGLDRGQLAGQGSSEGPVLRSFRHIRSAGLGGRAQCLLTPAASRPTISSLDTSTMDSRNG
jgi:hypothetical protein